MTDERLANVELLLARIAEALELIAGAAAVASSGDEDAPCLHPSEARTDFSTMGRPAWVCDPAKGGCGFSVGLES